LSISILPCLAPPSCCLSVSHPLTLYLQSCCLSVSPLTLYLLSCCLSVSSSPPHYTYFHAVCQCPLLNLLSCCLSVSLTILTSMLSVSVPYYTVLTFMLSVSVLPPYIILTVMLSVSVLLLAPVLTGILPVSVYSSASFHTACPCVHRVVPSPYVSVYFCPLFFSPLAVRFVRKQRYETKN
jgi:hypothetical protein